MRIWLDTDIGGDIDDALTLLLALADSRAETVGVSTVYENTCARAQIAKTLLSMGGRDDIPVYSGIGKPIRATTVHRLDVDLKKPPKTYIKSQFEDACHDGDDAVSAMKEAIVREDGGLNIVTLGALTNIAALIERFPEALGKINCLYIMGGAKKMNLNEFNFTCDPEAAAKVLEADIPKKIVTLDVTFECALSKEQIGRLKSCKSKLVKTVMAMSDMWGEGMILHDPLTLAAALSGEFVTFEASNLYVELEGKFSRGKCVDLCDFNWRYPAKQDQLVSDSVASSAFTEYFVSSVCELDEKLSR